ncbi:MAG: cache domain-containing protein [Gammaproteobacteria bacterium]
MNKVFGFVSFFLLLFIPSCLLIGVGGYLFAIADIRHQQRQLQTADASDVSKATIALRQQLHNMSAEVEFLAEMPAFQDLINNPSDEQFQKVAAYFKLSMTTHGLFDQIRWIDQSGKERLRLNYIDHSASVVLPADLQDKSHRSYFTKISKSSADTIFVSPFELNIEHEQIERPFKPVIRIGMAVFDSSNQRQGILIINYLGRNLLDEFVHSIGDKGNRLFLLNHEGYWLRGPKAEDEWGFMLKPSLTVAIQNVPLWRDIAGEE